MRIVDMMYGIPPEPFILVLALVLEKSAWLVVLAYVLFLWRTFSRLVRAETLSVSQRPYVKAAKAAGASDKRIMLFHIMPNVVPIIFIEATIMIGNGVLLEAGMSFLGYGAQDSVSWGTMLQYTFQSGAIRSAWWWVLPPGLSITLVVISFFYITRAIEEIIDPQLKSVSQ
jgi:ABC-type dipeptide/oligopeptide/nickel transport system permease subunit